MRVLVTGAAGFLGWNLVRLLLVRGHEVTAFVHKEADAARFGPVERVIAGDVTRRASVESAAKDADAIVHLALPAASAKVREAYPVWTQGTANLLAVARERGARAFVHASGAGGMYRHAPDAWVDEAAPEEPFTGVTRGRAEADAMVVAAHRDHGLPTVILRPHFVYGRGGAFQKFFVDYMRRGRYRVVGDGSNYMRFVHVADCALAYALAVEKAPAGETFLVVDDMPLTWRAASDVIADALRVRRPKTVPPFLARLVLGGDTVALVQESVRFRNQKLKELLGWSPTYPTLRDGLPSVVE